MRPQVVLVLVVALGCAAGCARKADPDKVAPGTNVTIKRTDGVTVVGRLVEVRPDAIVVDDRDGGRKTLRRDAISSMGVTEIPLTPQPNAAGAQAEKQAAAGEAPPVPSPTSEIKAPAAAARAPELREVTIPAGTVLPARLETALASDTSHVEDPVRAHLTSAIVVHGTTVLPEGSDVLGSVTNAIRAGKVKGRATLGIRFDRLTADAEQYDIQSAAVSRLARGTKQKDAMKIGVPAAGGAVVGGLLGGKKGAAIGSAAGGGAGTAMVLSTRGEEVRLPRGTALSIRLTAPLTVRVRR